MTENGRDPCPAHEYMLREISNGFAAIKDLIADLRADTHRRWEESAADRANLHESHNELAKEVTRAMTRLNGAVLYKGHPHHRDGNGNETDSIHLRKSDSMSGWMRENWLILTAITAAAFAGEKIIPEVLAFLKHLFAP